MSTGPVSPHVRAVDPDAEAARLAEERKLKSGTGHVLADEISVLGHDGEHGTLRVTVMCSLAPPDGVPADLGRQIAALVRERCYPEPES